MKRVFIIGLIFLAGAVGYFRWQARDTAAGPPEATLIPMLESSDATGFAQATVPGAIQFPRDLGPHENYQTEWWYYTGNLAANDGRAFGFQLTFFRRALTPANPGRDCLDPGCPATSAWRTNQIYLAHFTISDLAEDLFFEAERFSRGAAGLAGAQAEPYRVWLENWSVEAIDSSSVRLRARTEQVGLDLNLEQTVPPILHGDQGLSPKGPAPGNASYYYSIVQQEASGRITVGNEVFDVSGVAWKDHEYSTSALSADAVGWDWFSIQLDQGQALMFFQIRKDDGRIDPFSSGTFIQADGSTTSLSYTDWTLEVLDSWTSPESGATYPAGWRISIPSLELELTGIPMAADQELNLSTIYWEGAVAFDGTMAAKPRGGRGYVELTGYAEDMSGRI